MAGNKNLNSAARAKKDKFYTQYALANGIYKLVQLEDDGGDFGGWDYFGFVYDMENAFNCHVDLVSTGINDKNFLEDIQQDEVILYAG